MEQKTVSIVPDELHPRDAYRLTTSVVVPRPIAWVSTVGSDGTLNLAPFSFFNAVNGNPPTIMFSVGQRQGNPKDTLRNVQETGEFVVHIVDEALAEAMNQTSGDWGYDLNEFELAGLETTTSIDVKPPRVAQAAIAMETSLLQMVHVEESKYTIILGRIVRFHIREDLLREDGLVEPTLLKPIARLGRSSAAADQYATLGKILSMQRPVVRE